LEGVPNHPVVSVSWYEALGYCGWLNTKLRDPATQVPESLAALLGLGDGARARWVVTLPSEAEWEKAARYPDGRRYAWGGDAFNPVSVKPTLQLRARVSPGQTFPVGTFSGPTGEDLVQDISGGVREWTRSVWKGRWPHRHPIGYPYEPDYEGLARECLNFSSGAFRILRGCSSDDMQKEWRSANRGANPPGIRSERTGFRVVVAPFAGKLDSVMWSHPDDGLDDPCA